MPEPTTTSRMRFLPRQALPGRSAGARRPRAAGGSGTGSGSRGRRPPVRGMTVVEQQQPRRVEAKEQQKGQQYGLGAQRRQSAREGQHPDENVNQNRRNVRGQAYLIGPRRSGLGRAWLAGTERETPDRGQHDGPA